MKKLAMISYHLTAASIAALILWCIGALVMSTFSLRIFGIVTSELLMMAILPILATAAGSALICITSSIVIIANHLTGNSEKDNSTLYTWGFRAVVLLGILMVAGLFAGDWASTRITKSQYTTEIERLVEENQQMLQKAGAPDLKRVSIENNNEVLRYIGVSNSKLNNPTILFGCSYLAEEKICELEAPNGYTNDTKDVKFKHGWKDVDSSGERQIDTLAYISRLEEDERDLVKSMISGKITKASMTDKDLTFRVYIPIQIKNKTYVLRMEKFTRNGNYRS